MRIGFPFTIAAAVLTLAAILPLPASAQCILANPSFEIAGSGGAVFGGWNQLGVVGSAGDAEHGSTAARVSGPDSGDPAYSGFWQSRDCAPGQQWLIGGYVRHPSGKPLTGQSSALVNVEWRDSAGVLISYESFPVAGPATPADEFVPFSLTSSPAPANTAIALLLIGVLQGRSDPSPDVHYDQVTFDSATPPTIDDLQWNDFPGGRTLEFGGMTWQVKGPGWYGPGYNYFSDDPAEVWVDAEDRLHLAMNYRGGIWRCAEVVPQDALGYGDYVLTTSGRLDLLDPQVVLGLFLWQYGPCWDPAYLWWNPYNEIDIEYGRWGSPSSDIGQFVAQPYDHPGNIDRFDAVFAPDEIVSHAMRWLPDRVEYRVWRGGPQDESPAATIAAWTYAGPHVPRPEQPRLHLNLWKLDGAPAGDQEVVFSGFSFTPEGGATAVGGGVPPFRPAGRLLPAAPNPFNPRTVLRFELERPQRVELAVYDPAGRLVRTLIRGPLDAGRHEAAWDGRDGGGRDLASGVYLVRLRGDGFVQAEQVTLVK